MAAKFNVGDIVKFNDGEMVEGEPVGDVEYVISEDLGDHFNAEALDKDRNPIRLYIEIWKDHDDDYPCVDRMHKVV